MQSVCRAGDARNSIMNRCFRTLILKLLKPLDSLEDNRDSYMNRFLRAPLVFSEAAQHGLAPFVVCSRGWGLSGFVT